MDEKDIMQTLRDWGGVKSVFGESFADAIEMFGHIEFAAWLLDETGGSYKQFCSRSGLDDSFTFWYYFMEAGYACDRDGDVPHPAVKRHLFDTALDAFSGAFERLCARYGTEPGTEPVEQARTLCRLRDEHKTDTVGGVLLFYRLWPRLDGNTAGQKHRAFEALGGRM